MAELADVEAAAERLRDELDKARSDARRTAEELQVRGVAEGLTISQLTAF